LFIMAFSVRLWRSVCSTPILKSGTSPPPRAHAHPSPSKTLIAAPSESKAEFDHSSLFHRRNASVRGDQSKKKILKLPHPRKKTRISAKFDAVPQGGWHGRGVDIRLRGQGEMGR
jgi:hypothetical protein